MKKIGLQILKEFWIQTSIAIGWAFYNSDPKQVDINIYIEFIKNFGAAFFLSSWFGGQILRIAKQQKLESSLSSMLEKIESLLTKIENFYNDLKGFTIGGESICYLDVFYLGNDESLQAVIQHGKYPLYHIVMTYRNLNDPHHEDITNRPNLEIGDIGVGLVKPISDQEINYKNAVDGLLKYEITFYSRKGHFVQDLLIFKFENIWHYACQVREDGRVVFSKVGENFPLKNPFGNFAEN